MLLSARPFEACFSPRDAFRVPRQSSASNAAAGCGRAASAGRAAGVRRRRRSEASSPSAAAAAEDVAPVSPVVVDYGSLLQPPAAAGPLDDALESAFGPAGLGIIAVAGVPGYEEARGTLLPLSRQLAMLPQASLARLEDEASRYNLGWSLGRERLAGGKPDTSKGSFYFNPHDEAAGASEALPAALSRPNRWPDEELPHLRPAATRLSAIMLEAGARLALHCDAFVCRRLGQTSNTPSNESSSSSSLSSVLSRSRCHKRCGPNQL